jgi:hypothetical protein
MNNCESADARQGPKPARKRKRTAHACEPCRQRKSRCDGSRPVCDLCVEQGVECYYRDSATIPTAKIDQQPLAQLEIRLRDMERLLQRLVPVNSQERTSSPTLSAQNDTRDGGAYPGSVDMHGRDAISEEAIRVELASDASKSVWPTDLDDSVDGMGSITFKGETSSGVFGTIVEGNTHS